MPKRSGFTDEQRARSGAIRPGSRLNTPTGDKEAKAAAKASVEEGRWVTGRKRERFCVQIKRDGTRCGKSPMRHSDRCKFHLVGHKERQAAVRTQLELTVEKLNQLGVAPVPRDPREVLLEQVYSSSAMASALQGLVRDLEEKHLKGIGELDFQPTDNGVVPIPDRDGSIAEARLTLYASWVDRAARVAKMALDAGVEERLVRLAEHQATLIVTTLRNVLAQLDLSPQQLELAQRLAANEFRLLAARPVEALTGPSTTTDDRRP